MISQRDRGELARFYTVTDPKKHQKGYTVYKVTARVRKAGEGKQTGWSAKLMLGMLATVANQAMVQTRVTLLSPRGERIAGTCDSLPLGLKNI